MELQRSADKTWQRSLEFIVNRVLTKVFRTTTVHVIRMLTLVWSIGDEDADCQVQRFLTQFAQYDNVLCQLFARDESMWPIEL